MINLDQKRHLATILCLVEKDLRYEEGLLRSRGERGILYEIVDALHEEQLQAILAEVAILRGGIARLKERFDLTGEQTNMQRMLQGKFNMLWVWLQEATAKNLKGYGAVDEGLQQGLDPLLEEMGNRVDKILQILAEA